MTDNYLSNIKNITQRKKRTSLLKSDLDTVSLENDDSDQDVSSSNLSEVSGPVFKLLNNSNLEDGTSFKVIFKIYSNSLLVLIIALIIIRLKIVLDVLEILMKNRFVHQVTVKIQILKKIMMMM